MAEPPMLIGRYTTVNGWIWNDEFIFSPQVVMKVSDNNSKYLLVFEFIQKLVKSLQNYFP